MKLEISNSDLNKIYLEIKPMLNKNIKNIQLNENSVIAGNNSLFDSLDFLTLIMAIEKFFSKNNGLTIDLSSNLGNIKNNSKITIKYYLKLNNIKIKK